MKVAPVFRVADLDRSISYYRERLGFAVDFEYQGFYAGLERDGCHVHLKHGESPQREGAPLEEADEHADACFTVHDAADLAARLEAAGATIAISLRSAPYGKEFYVSDPDGHILAFVEPSR